MEFKIFTLDQANALLPRVERLLRELQEKKQAAVSRYRQMDTMRRQEVSPLPRKGNSYASVAAEFAGLEREMKALLDEISGLGAVVKDLDGGLVDFPGVIDRQPIYLCWKLGEPDIGFYHPADGGYATRQPVVKKNSTR